MTALESVVNWMPKRLPTVDEIIEYVTNDETDDFKVVNPLWLYYDNGEAKILVDEIIRLREEASHGKTTS